ncbi:MULTISPECIES: hypothetical protein [Rhodopirellula]|uniref:hypothetical protein n=1 Tax=Rhodopirellula TaxID=265488 RepID=UPI002579B9D9|nr:hypothetical protein [Rhodopirellula sp. UBA1907]|tara:strand:+ start:292 stop:450 length:159 start_codon:yes stop_codon:yes gene_type:complete
MPIRAFLPVILFFVLLGGGLLGAEDKDASVQMPPPNIVLVMTDDQGYDWAPR